MMRHDISGEIAVPQGDATSSYLHASNDPRLLFSPGQPTVLETPREPCPLDPRAVAYPGCRYGITKLLCRLEPGPRRIEPVMDSLLGRFPIRHTAWEIRKRNQISASIFLRQWRNLEGIVFRSHDLLSSILIHELHKLTDVYRLDRPLRWNGKLAAIRMTKYHVARPLLPPLDPRSPRHRLQVVNAPISGIIAHLLQDSVQPYSSSISPCPPSRDHREGLAYRISPPHSTLTCLRYQRTYEGAGRNITTNDENECGAGGETGSAFVVIIRCDISAVAPYAQIVKIGEVTSPVPQRSRAPD